MDKINTCLEIAERFDVLGKAGKVVNMLAPYLGMEKIAVDTYVNDIKASNMNPETKAYLLLTTKQKFKQMKRQAAIVEKAVKENEKV